MQAYARLMDNALELIDDILTRVPTEGATPRSILDELDKAKATAMAKFDKMDANYDLQSVSDELTEDMETAHTKTYNDAKGRYKKAMHALNAVLDARPVQAKTVTVQAPRPPARIVEDLKPSEKLTSTMSLEAMRSWAEQYRNFMEQNAKAFE